jgi:hypothetical protein
MLFNNMAGRWLILSALMVSSTVAWKPNDCGYYYPPGSTTEVPQVPCLPGFYCPLKPGVIRITPVICPGGRYCPGATCVPLNCTCGYKCPRGSSAPIECQPPFYCPKERATNQTICPIGFYCPVPGMCKPLKCPPGTFVTCAGKVRCEICDRGRYCPIPTKSMLCPKDYYCPAGSSAPTPCPKSVTCLVGTWALPTQLGAEKSSRSLVLEAPTKESAAPRSAT